MKNQKISMSSREASTRDLPLDQSVTVIKKGTNIYLNEERRRCRITNFRHNRPFCMNSHNAFTLIELLVVVLIIGILAAVAVPQYQFAVDKTRAMTHFQNAQDIIKAEQVYKMANGNYTGDFEALDVDFTKTCVTNGACHNELTSCPGNWAFHISCNANTTAEPTLLLLWCTTTSCGSWTTRTPFAMHIAMDISLTDGAIKQCTHYTNRGQKLCNYFTQQFGTGN